MWSLWHVLPRCRSKSANTSHPARHPKLPLILVKMKCDRKNSCHACASTPYLLREGPVSASLALVHVQGRIVRWREDWGDGQVALPMRAYEEERVWKWSGEQRPEPGHTHWATGVSSQQGPQGASGLCWSPVCREGPRTASLCRERARACNQREMEIIASWNVKERDLDFWTNLKISYFIYHILYDIIFYIFYKISYFIYFTVWNI